MYEFPFGETLDRGRRPGLSVLYMQKGFRWDRVRESAEVEGPDIPTDYLRGVNYNSESQLQLREPTTTDAPRIREGGSTVQPAP